MTPDGQTVIFSDADFDELPVPGVKEIEVLEFVPSEQVDPVLFARSYYLEPEARAVKPYVLLREALVETERTAIVKVTIRTRQQLAALRVRGEVMVLQTMLWPDEVRPAEFGVLDATVDIRPQEQQMAASLIGNLSRDFDPGEYRDEYREAVLAMVEAKVAGGEALPAPEAAPVADDGQVLDLMAALQASVERSRAARGDSTPAAGAVPAEAPAATDGDAPATATPDGTEEAAPAKPRTRRRKAG